MNYVIGNGITLMGNAIALYSHKTSTIALGCDIKYHNNNWHKAYSFYNQFSCVEEYYEECIVSIITHEYIHHLIERDVDEPASVRFDDIDTGHEITLIVCDEHP